MGWGDDLLAAGEAYYIHKKHQSRVAICNQRGPYWSALWDGLDFLVKPKEPITPDVVKFYNASGMRTYLHSIHPQDGSKFNLDYRAHQFRPIMRFTPKEIEDIKAKIGLDRYVIIEPNMAAKSCINKRIPFPKWQAVVNVVPTYWVQLVWDYTYPLLEGVKHVHVKSFRESCAAIAMSSGVVAGEGGPIHAAAACMVPATVVCTGMTPKDVITYPDHEVLYNPDHDGCGNWVNCHDCQTFANGINPYDIARKVMTMHGTFNRHWLNAA